MAACKPGCCNTANVNSSYVFQWLLALPISAALAAEFWIHLIIQYIRYNFPHSIRLAQAVLDAHFMVWIWTTDAC